MITLIKEENRHTSLLLVTVKMFFLQLVVYTKGNYMQVMQMTFPADCQL